MSSRLYTTKALGREWLPLPMKRSLHDRKSRWTLFRNHVGGEDMRSWKEKMPSYVATKWSDVACEGGVWTRKRLRWSRIHGRIALSILIIGVLCFWGGRGGGDSSSTVGLLGTNDKTHEMMQNPIFEQEETRLRMHNDTWSDFAYVTLATDLDGLCNAVMLIDSLHRVGVQAERVILYPEYWDLLSPSSAHWGLLERARADYTAQLRTTNIRQKVHLEKDATEREQRERDVAILEGFGLTEYRRVLVLDAQSTLLRSMDEVFLLDEEMVVDVAAPSAYWRNEGKGGPYAMTELNEAMALIRPSEEGWEKVQGEMKRKRKRKNSSKRGVASRVFGKEAMVLAHKPYTLLSREFHENGHDAYLGGQGVWDPLRALAEAKVVLFGGDAVRPWEGHDGKGEQVRPQCKTMVNGADVRQDCADREVWDWLYAEFAERRMRVCGMGPAG